MAGSGKLVPAPDSPLAVGVDQMVSTSSTSSSSFTPSCLSQSGCIFRNVCTDKYSIYFTCNQKGHPSPVQLNLPPGTTDTSLPSLCGTCSTMSLAPPAE
mmetsp:Transcript_31866/g.74734  ORF Transcript_31866/g.74734 Transcript_31866/m.74734 type:complete len:99 (+) Transcript_31866:952-1248(+)